MGGPLFGWQRYVADVASEIDPRTGEFWYDKVVILAPRRSGKTYLERSVVAERCSRKQTLAMMTAQTRDHAADRWAEVVYSQKDSLVNAPGMSELLHVTRGNSNEQCSWRLNGSVFVPFAPKEDAIHGADPDLVWVTELWWHGLATKHILQSAYRPVWSVKEGQEWLESAGGTSRSLWMKSERAAGAEAVHDPLSRTAFFCWGVPGSADELMALDDDDLVDVVMAQHPRAGNGLRRDYLLGELRDPEKTRAEFLRHYGTVDADDASTTLVLPKQWQDSSTFEQIPHSDTGAQVGVGVAIDPRGSAICAAWVRPDGATLVEVVASQPGQAWTVEYVVAMPGVAALAVNARGLGKKVADAAVREGIELVRFGQIEQHAAGTDFVTRLVEPNSSRRLLHVADSRLDAELPHAELTRTSGIGSRDGELAVTLEAAAAAVWAAEHAPEPAPRRSFWIA